MLRATLVGLGSGLRLGFTPIFEPSLDAVTIKTPITESGDDPNETGWDRVRAIFESTDHYSISQELNTMNQAGFAGVLFGGLYGGMIRARRDWFSYMENNTWTQYESHIDAKRHLQQEITIAFGKGCFRWGWRMGLFTYAFTAFLTISSAYRGAYGLTEFVVAGAGSGALYKCNLGLRGMVSGGVFGALMGTVGGGLSLICLNIAGVNIKDVRKYQFKYQAIREEAMKDGPMPTDNEELKSEVMEAVKFGHPTASNHSLDILEDLPTESEEKEREEDALSKPNLPTKA